VPKINVNWDDMDALEDVDMPNTERIHRQPKEERILPKKEIRKSHYNPERAAKKEYVEDEQV